MQPFLRILPACLLLLLLPICAQGQVFPYKEFTVADGLAHPIVFDIAQDRNGFIWIATDNGLSRINGTNATTIPIPGQKGAMSFTCFSQPDSGGLLVSSSDNKVICRIDKSSEIHSLPIPQDILSPGMLITRFCSLRNRQYFIWDNRYRTLYFADKDRIDKVNLEQGQQSLLIYRIIEQEGRVYFATSEGLFEYAGRSIKKILTDRKEIYWISFDKAGNLWAIGEDNLYCRKKNAAEFLAYRHHISKKINYFSISSRGEIVIASYDELFLMSGDSLREIKNITSRLDLKYIVVTSLFFDDQDNLWVGTYGQGVRCYYDLDVLIYRTGNDFQGIFPKYFFTLGDRFLICDGEKGYCVSLEEDSLHAFPAPERFKGPITRISGYKNTSLLVTNTDVFSYAGGRLNRLLEGRITDFLQEADRAYVVEGNALYLLEEGQGVRKVDFHVNNLAMPVTRICRMNDNLYAVATPDALYTINIDSATRKITSSKKIIPYPNATLLHYNPDLSLLVAGGKDGLCLISNSSKKIFTTADKLISNTINDVAFFNNRLLIGTLGGLNMYDLKTRELSAIGKPFLKQEIISVNTWRDKVIIGTPSGIISLKNPDLEPPGKQFFIRSDTGLTAVDLLPGNSYQNGAETDGIPVEELDLSFENETGLYYRIRPIDEAYKKVMDGNIPVNRLPPGEFHVELAYASNGLLKTMNLIPFHVSARWYQTKGGIFAIISFIALAAGGMSYMIFRLLETRRRKLHLINDRMILLEIKALSALLHPHFIFNALSSIHYLINQRNMDMVNRYLGKFSKLIRTNLETLHKGINSLEDELEKITLYLELEKLRFSDRFSYRILVSDKVSKTSFMIPVMLLQPFAENALLHGLTHMTGGEITIRIKTTPEAGELLIEIEDNGQGIHASHHIEDGKSSLGIEIIQNRFSLLSRIYKKPFTINIEDKTKRAVPDNGTLVTLHIWNLTMQNKYAREAAPDHLVN